MGAVVSSKPSADTSFRQKVRGVVSSLLTQYFKGTLGAEQNATEYIMGLIQFESSMRPGIRGPSVSEVPTAKQAQGSSRAKQYMNSDPVKAITLKGDAAQKKNIQSGKVAQGLMQVMGWNIVRGGSSTAKKCEIEETRRPEMIERLCVHAGDSIEAKLLGEENIENNILAGLLILETKYNATRRKGAGWSAGGAVFTTRLGAAVGAYLGVAGRDLVTGVTADAYVASILGGEAYKVANGASAGASNSTVRTASNSSSGPSTNGSDVPAGIPGCA